MNHSNRDKAIIDEMLTRVGITPNGAQPFDIQIHNEAMYARVLKDGSLGLGESYMDGWWDCQRPDQFFSKILEGRLDKTLPKHIRDLLHVIVIKTINLQSRKRAWIVGKEHYDLGNDLFQAMLDPYMQYSCAYWKTADTLADAQEAKLKMICEKLRLKPGMRLLDIGCGWGGLAQYAAEHYGVCVTGVTISQEQQIMAQERCRGLDVTILLQDYRDLKEKYERIVSVGMFEHVGPKNYQEYFKVVSHILDTNGLFLLHTIGANKTDNNVDSWINKYIFPNGCLPSVLHIAKASESRLVMEDWHNFGADYDKTLMAWYQNFTENWDKLADHYSNRFKRMFSYYLNCCAGAFRVRDIQLWQILFSKNGVRGGIRVPH